MIHYLGELVADSLGRQVHVAFVDVLGPTPSDVLTQVAQGGPAVLVPAFLSRGYHVRADIPHHVASSGHHDVVVTPPLGPGAGMVRVLFARLTECGWRPGDGVVLAAAGTSDSVAQQDVRIAATLLSTMTGSRVEPTFAAIGRPPVADAVAALRRSGCRRVAVASYLLADGLFHDQLRQSGADVTSEPLGTHPATVRLIADRFRRARLSAA